MLRQKFGSKSVVFYMTFCCIFLFSFHSISCELVIRVGTVFDWPPYVYKSGKDVAGLEVEVLDTVLSKTSFCREFVEMPSSRRALEELKHNRVDLLLGVSFHHDRELYADFSLSYRNEKIVVFAQKKFTNLAPVHDNHEYLEPLNQQSSILAVNLGSVYGEDFERFVTGFEGGLVNTISSRQRFDMLKKDRIDYAIEDELTGLALLSDKNYSQYIKNTRMVVNYDAIHYLLRPGIMSENQFNQFNKAIDDSRFIIKTIMKKYTSNS